MYSSLDVIALAFRRASCANDGLQETSSSATWAASALSLACNLSTSGGQAFPIGEPAGPQRRRPPHPAGPKGSPCLSHSPGSPATSSNARRSS
jgi:hypothetical protein